MKRLLFCMSLLLLTLGQISALAQDRRVDDDQQQDMPNTPGELHNEGVQFILQHIQAVPSPSETRPLVIKLADEFCASADLDCPSGSPLPVPSSTEELLASIEGSKTFKDDLRLMFELINNIRPNAAAPGLSLQQYEVSLTDLETTVAGKLGPEERTRFLGAVSTARMSGLFWAPTEEGGLNGIHFLNTNGTTPATIDWGKVVLADVQGFLGGGLKGAIIASVINLLGQLL